MPLGSPDQRDRWSAVALAVIAVAYLVAGRRYPLDTLAAPGPGIVPLIAGLTLLALAAWQFLGPRRAPAPDRPLDRAPLLMSLVLVLYAAALPVLGFVLASFGLVVVSARGMGLAGWWRPVALALGVTLASRVLFGAWLGVPLP
jgi:putative tricarboxylic transport membrane protein